MSSLGSILSTAAGRLEAQPPPGPFGVLLRKPESSYHFQSSTPCTGCETRASVIATSMLIWRGNIRAPMIVLLLSQHTGQQPSQDCSAFFQQLRPSGNYECIRQDLPEPTCKNFLTPPPPGRLSQEDVIISRTLQDQSSPTPWSVTR